MARENKDESTISEVAERLGLSVHTLRYYEHEGLLPGIRRTAGGRRAYTENDVAWLTMCLNLRGTGMPIAKIRDYVRLAEAGDEGPALAQMLSVHRTTVQAQLDMVTHTLELIDYKIALYAAPAGDLAETATPTRGADQDQ